MITQEEILIEFFKKNPNRDIKHPEVVDWAVEEYKKQTQKVFRDPDRGIRKLAQKGFLIKVNKGVYRYDPKYIKERDIEYFTFVQKQEILKRDNYVCAICVKGIKNGV